MKCIKCGTDNNLQDRVANQGRCKNCHHRFAFEPMTMSAKTRFTDQFFAKLLNDISANNTLYFTQKQLFYLLEKRLAKKERKTDAVGIIGCGLILVVIGFFAIVTAIGWPFIVIGLLVVFFGWLKSQSKAKYPRTLVINQSMTEAWLERWEQANHTPEKFLQQPRQQSIPVNIEPDIAIYSFDRLVVCDRAEIAQMLIANNFHFDNNCAVLSITGYPQSIFEPTMQMLRNNPNLQVYGLHDCSPDGMKLLHQLQTDANWFAQSNMVIADVGLLPRQFMATKRNMPIQITETSAAAAKALPTEIRQNLLPQELAWLESGNFVELESFTPLRLMQSLNSSIAKSNRNIIESSDQGLGGMDLTVENDNDNYFYVIDSFG
ncbi:MAG: hypothetical protein F6K21_10105 [Symploca sp. SIO2D2]|nr:hypothetical protein [Symploca sp. SIO2D2]